MNSRSDQHRTRKSVSAALMISCALAGVLCGCEGDGGKAGGNASELIPASVQSIIDGAFSADGEIHVRSKGRLEIKPETEICRIRAAVDRSMKQEAPAFYGPGIEGVDNGYLNENLNGKTCINDGNNIVSHWLLVKNRTNTPYKLILAAWQSDPAQGGAIWVGAVERLQGWRPDTTPEKVMGEEDHARSVVPFLAGDDSSDKRVRRANATRLSVAEDIQDISRAFQMELTGNETVPTRADGNPA